jgi:hypothetical protein
MDYLEQLYDRVMEGKKDNSICKYLVDYSYDQNLAKLVEDKKRIIFEKRNKKEIVSIVNFNQENRLIYFSLDPFETLTSTFRRLNCYLKNPQTYGDFIFGYIKRQYETQNIDSVNISRIEDDLLIQLSPILKELYKVFE